MKLRKINWLCANVDENSLDDASRHIAEATTSKMQAQVSTDDVRRTQSGDSTNGSPEDAISNKFKHLDVLCFPTLFPTGRVAST